ncbi:MAG: hypothetical protein R3A51_09675 [Nannocystaceae bacterium]|nr:hypothetical protein [Myxococcales bacterium]
MKPGFLECSLGALTLALSLACTVGGEDPTSGFSGGGPSGGAASQTSTATGTTDDTAGTDTAGTDTGVSGTETETTMGPTSDPSTTEEPTTDPSTTVEPTTEPSTTVEPTTDPTGGPVCGNNMVEDGEVCDGGDLNGQSCVTFGFDGGNLACTGACMFDTSGCMNDPGALCGNNMLEAGEACDGNQLNGKTCADFGFSMGNLACTGGCTFDTSGCSNGAMCQNQPATGHYSHCFDPNECSGFMGSYGCVTLGDINNPTDGICTSVGCANNASCPSVAGCTATGSCEIGLFNNGADNGCLLDCSNGKTCPGGMQCFNITDIGNRCF